MELSQLRYFKHVAKTGKIAESSKELFVSAAALSYSIAKLEKELGVQLFDRVGNRIKLNAHGEIFLRYVNQVFTSLNCAKIELEQSVQENIRQIQLAVTTSNIWIPFLSEFSIKHTDISVASTTLKLNQLESASLFQQYSFLLADRSDLPEEVNNDINSIFLFEDEPQLMVNKHHPLANEKEVNIQVLQKERLILPMPGQSFTKRLKVFLRRNGISTQNVYECAYMTCRSLVEDGAGVSFVTKYGYEFHKHAETEICYVPIHKHNCQWEQVLCWRKDRELSNEEKTFVKDICEFFSVKR